MLMTGKRDHTLVLGGEAGIKSASDVLAKLREALEKHARVNIDTQAMTSADITTVQTLLSARAKAEASGKTLRMLAPLGAPLAQVLAAGGFLSPQGAQAAFWTPVTDQPAGN